MKFIPISWQQLEKDTIHLAKKVRDEYGKIDEIVAISRGGIVIGRILSDILEAKISFITIESYQGFKQGKEPVVTQELDSGQARMTGKKILLVDELAESGETFIKGLEYIKKLPIKSVITACLYIKPKTKYIPHFYTKKHDGWIILPYELRETKAALIEELGLQKAKMQLKKLGITDWSDVS